MHELGILRQIVRVVEQVADRNIIKSIKHITLEVGNDSGVVPYYMRKLFPLAVDAIPLLKNTELHIRMVSGKGLVIKDIGY
ncbi:MAG: hydrogenase maturation nickel metallochaperone HypA [Eubacterium sp.]|nr:hydrogenase maturation nickel metallochaperone HypA [Eubacterium sp.]